MCFDTTTNAVFDFVFSFLTSTKVVGEISYAITYIGASVQSNDLVHLI
jgi:hypothetical protein